MAARLSDPIRIVSGLLLAKLRFKFLRGSLLGIYQNLRARRLLRFAAGHSRFHAERLRGFDLRHWRQIPAIEKRDMMENFDAYNTVGVPLEGAMEVAAKAEESRVFSETVAGFTVGLSSGTSGHRGIFLVSRLEQLRWAGEILSRTLPGVRLKGWTVAMFTRANSNLYEALGSRWLRFRHFDLMTPLPNSVEELNRLKPDVLVALPSLLLLLCKEKLSGRLAIAPIRVISVADVLEPHEREWLEDTFAVPVHQVYQCTEGLIAACCERGSLHILEDVMAVDLEVLSEDEENIRSVPVITDLWRTTQPIIRYRMNDVIVVKKELCACGSAFRVLDRIEGRTDDVLLAFDREGNLKPVFADLVRRILLLSPERISDYSVVQRTPMLLEVHVELESTEDFSVIASSLKQRFDKTFAGLGLIPPDISVELGIPAQDLMVKRRRVRRMFALNSLTKQVASAQGCDMAV